MKIYFLNELNFKRKDAGYKARFDAAKIFTALSSHNKIVYEEKKIPLWGKWYQRLFNGIELVLFLISRNKCDTVIFNYPLPKPFIEVIFKVKKIKNINICLLIHDIDILRGEKSRDLEYLLNADYVISHNRFMTSYLISHGIKESNVINLDIFDYISDSPLNNEYENTVKGIVFAGNLSQHKSAFLYSEVCDNNVFKLYGVNYDKQGLAEYNGSFEASDPGSVIDVSGIFFGLVWDGDSVESCSGSYGEYLKFNNPHKTSLYLSLGIPIITWNQSAIADFITKNNIGITVSSISEAVNILENMSFEEYKNLRTNTQAISRMVRDGSYLKAAIGKIPLSKK